jgi:hypothetical protein
MRILIALMACGVACAQLVPLDLSGVRPGPVRVAAEAGSVAVEWPDEASRTWRAVFSLDPSKPLIASIGTGGAALVERANPVYRCATGIRRGGWDAFFDFPPSHPEGTRQFEGVFRLKSARATSVGDRVEVTFDGLKMGIFEGGVSYVFFPGSRLVQQQAVVTTQAPDVAYYYDTGLRMASDADRRPGGNMESEVAYYDTDGRFRTVASGGPERQPVAVRYRALALRMARGSVALFPAPHQYFFARDYTTNMAYLWHRSWRGEVALGVRQLPDDNSPFYPWMNAPPRTVQRMGVFLLLDDLPPRHALDQVLRYTHSDHFPALAGYKTLATHWHYAYTVQAMEKGLDWTPPFKPVLKAMGVDSAMIMDFHGDGHPRDLTELRLKELDAFYRACRAQSDTQFLLIPAEEANVHLGGHWSLVFPKPVYWFMDRPAGAEFRGKDTKYGTVYHTGNARELLELVRQEGGYMYQTHPRTKGSTGFPDKIRDTEHFMDARYLGAGWKAMPSDLSSPRLGERSLKLLDDMGNWGMHKRLIGEVDVFQIDATHELYAHMNVNYVRAASLPSFDRYGTLLDAVARGDFFISTGEILLPDVRWDGASAREIAVKAKISHTFPLQVAEIVWGNGNETFRTMLPLDTTREFTDTPVEKKIEANGWKWARFAAWDVAGNGAFTNPIWSK